MSSTERYTRMYGARSGDWGREAERSWVGSWACVTGSFLGVIFIRKEGPYSRDGTGGVVWCVVLPLPCGG